MTEITLNINSKHGALNLSQAKDDDVEILTFLGDITEAALYSLGIKSPHVIILDDDTAAEAVHKFLTGEYNGQVGQAACNCGPTA